MPPEHLGVNLFQMHRVAGHPVHLILQSQLLQQKLTVPVAAVSVCETVGKHVQLVGFKDVADQLPYALRDLRRGIGVSFGVH